MNGDGYPGIGELSLVAFIFALRRNLAFGFLSIDFALSSMNLE